MTEEIWKDVNDSNGQYKISNTGKVMSFKRYKDGEILKGCLRSDKYSEVNLVINNKKQKILIHRLVAIHFVDNPDESDIVDHIDRDRQNNNSNNLRWTNKQINSLNSSFSSRNTSGCKGITYLKKNDKWRVRWFEGTNEQGKYCKTKLEAINHRIEVLKLHYPEEYVNDEIKYLLSIQDFDKPVVSIDKSKDDIEYEDEIWKDIDNTNRLYKISNYGRVKSFRTNKDGLVLKGNISISNYKRYLLTLSDKSLLYIFAHKLVGEYFLDNPNNYNIVDHIDGNSLNNHVNNLRWVNNQQNTLNSKLPISNKSGKKGVWFHQGRNKWVAFWTVNGKKQEKHFKNFEEAVIHREEMEILYYESDFLRKTDE
jgi:hypothetical protein